MRQVKPLKRLRLLKLWVWWDVWARDLVVVVAIALSLWSTIQTQRTVATIQSEGADRRDQQCVIFEQKQRSDVEALIRTYQYLAALSARELATPLNRAVLAGLPATVRDAETDDAPAYCRDPGVGLDEAPLKVPRRPRNLPVP